MKKNCYIYWDGPEVKEDERNIYIQCEECFKKSGKGIRWGGQLLHGTKTIKCTVCGTIIYQKAKKKQKGADEASI